jgi:hypothetical protein
MPCYGPTLDLLPTRFPKISKFGLRILPRVSPFDSKTTKKFFWTGMVGNGPGSAAFNRSHRGIRKSALKTNTSAWIALSVPVRACRSVWRSRSRCAQLASSCASNTNAPPTKAPYRADPDPDELKSFESQEASGTVHCLSSWAKVVEHSSGWCSPEQGLLPTVVSPGAI